MKIGLLRAWWNQRRAPTSGTTPIASIIIHDDGRPPDLDAEPHPEVVARRAELEAEARSRRRR